MTAGSRIALDNTVGAFDDIDKDLTLRYWIPRGTVVALVVCMRAAGWKEADYDDMMAVSGFGAGFAYHPNKTWPQYITDPEFAQRIGRVTGFGWASRKCETVEEYWTCIRDLVDKGKPSVATYYEDLVFAGYEDAARHASRKVRVLTPAGHVPPNTWWTWAEFEGYFRNLSRGLLYFHSERQTPLPPKDAAVDVLKRMVTMARADDRGEDKSLGVADVKWGLAGIEAYARDVGEPALQPASDFDEGWCGNFAVYPQMSGRSACGAYLKRLAGRKLFSLPLNKFVGAAADGYRAAYEAWLRYDEELGTKEDAKDVIKWKDAERRRAGAEAIREALTHETFAIERIEELLSAL